MQKTNPPRASRPAPSAITFPVKDIFGEQFARRQYDDLWHTLHFSPREYNCSSSRLEINRLTGELRRVTEEYHGEHLSTHYSSCTEWDVQNCGNEKLKDFTADNWRAYVPEAPPKPVPQRAALVVSAEACRPGKQTDVDAYFMQYKPHGGYGASHCIYLRRCDTGWRLFRIWVSPAEIFIRAHVEYEQHLKKRTEGWNAFDRLLTADETAYVMNLLPDRHDGIEGVRTIWTEVMGCYGRLETCYWKDGFCVDCAQLPHLPALFEKLVELAERGLLVE